MDTDEEIKEEGTEEEAVPAGEEKTEEEEVPAEEEKVEEEVKPEPPVPEEPAKPDAVEPPQEKKDWVGGHKL